MIYEDQKTLLKRLLRYARKNRTDTHKAYVTLMSSAAGRSGPVLKMEGKTEAWGQMVRYMESLMRELDGNIAKFDPPMEDDDTHETVAEIEMDMEAYDV